jgi:hypothetical protein
LLNFVKTEPVLLTGAVQAVLALLSATVVSLTADETGALLAASSAVLALIAAAATRKVSTSVVTGFTTAVVTLLVAFGVPGVNPGIVSVLNGAVTAVMALILRQNVTPVASLPKTPPAHAHP